MKEDAKYERLLKQFRRLHDETQTARGFLNPEDVCQCVYCQRTRGRERQSAFKRHMPSWSFRYGWPLIVVVAIVAVWWAVLR